MKTLMRSVCVCWLSCGLSLTAVGQESGPWRANVHTAKLLAQGNIQVDFDAVPSEDDEDRFAGLLKALLAAENVRATCEWNRPEESESMRRTVKLAGLQKGPALQLLKFDGCVFTTMTLRPLTAEEIQIYEEAFGYFIEGLCLLENFHGYRDYRFIGTLHGQVGNLAYFYVIIRRTERA